MYIACTYVHMHAAYPHIHPSQAIQRIFQRWTTLALATEQGGLVRWTVKLSWQTLTTVIDLCQQRQNTMKRMENNQNHEENQMNINIK